LTFTPLNVKSHTAQLHSKGKSMRNQIIIRLIIIISLLNCYARANDHHAKGGEPSSKGPVKSLNGLVGDVTLSAGPGIEIAPAGNGLTISAESSVPTSLNGLTGPVTLSAGSGITITALGNGLSIGAQVSAPTNFWSTAGNQTTPGDFLGTLNFAPLDLKVNGQRALRLEPAGPSANLIGGAAVNFASPGVMGVTISGGGAVPPLFGFNFGDLYNSSNFVAASFGTIGGGLANRIEPSALASTITGGLSNTNGQQYSSISGGSKNAVYGEYSVIGGGSINIIETTDFGCTIGGGAQNRIGTNAYQSTVGGGAANLILASCDNSTIGGGVGNRIGFGAPGFETAPVCTIAGGAQNNAWGTNCTVGGGRGNITSGTAATVSGGYQNRSDNFGFVGGGVGNFSGLLCAIGGGSSNDAFGALTGGATIGGGINNQAGELGTIGGGEGNRVAAHGTVAGGYSNWAFGDYSFAAGNRARTFDFGAFVWADASGIPFSSTAPNQFNVRASGGVRIFSDSAASVGVQLAAGGNSWAPTSDRNAKENFQPTDGREVLSRVAALPIQTYNMRTQDPAIRHIGPTAQDFYAAFGVGEDDKHITTIDADGIALAAIQGLNEVVKEKDGKISALERRVADLEKLIGSLAQGKTDRPTGK
jgi:hypothetical protein